MLRAFAVCLVALFIVGCGPRPLSAQEKAANAAEQVARDREAKAKEAQAKVREAKARIDEQKANEARAAAKLKAKQDELRAEHEARVRVYRRWQLGKEPLPRGVTQLSSTEFLVDRKFSQNGRYLCSGPILNMDNSKVGDTDPNDTDSVTSFDSGHLKYTCVGPVRKYRDAGFKP